MVIQTSPAYKGSLFRKYAIVVGLLITLALLVNNLASAYFSYQKSLESLAAVQQEKANSAAMRVAEYFEELGRQLADVSRLAATSARTPTEVGIGYIERLRTIPAFTALTLVDPQGRERYRVSRVEPDSINSLRDLSQSPEFIGAKTKGYFRSGMHFVNESEPHIRIAMAVQPPEVGVVIAEVSLELLTHSVTSTQLGSSGYAYAVDAQGRLVAHKDLNQVLNNAPVSDLPQVQAALRSSQQPIAGSASSPLGLDLDGKKVITAHSTIEALNWTVFVDQPEDEAMAPLFAALIQHTSLMLAIAVGLSLLVSGFMVRRLVRPIQALKDSAQRIAGGSLDQSIVIGTGDELQALGEQFNLMADSLKASYEGLEKKAAELEVVNRELQAQEQQLAQALEQSQKASAAKSEFLAMVSHELRTPLTGVLGMLKLSLRSSMAAQLRERLESAMNNAQTLHGIVNNLLDLTQMEGRTLQPEQRPYALRPWLAQVLQPMHERAIAKRLAWTLELDEGTPEWLVGDADRLGQVLLNIVGNAIKFTESGEIRIALRCLTPQPSPAGSPARLQFQVIDTGIGMGAQTQAKLFQSFEQADRSSTRKFEGLGLGLAVSKQLIELLGGSIAVKSELGRGSTFTVELAQQVDAPPPAIAVQTPAAAAQQAPLHVLVAEDVPTNQILIEALLEELGHTVTLVDNGELALLALVKEPFDLVLMDGRMPVMDGLEATRHIRAGHYQGAAMANKNIPVIALTANVSENDRANFLAAGADAFLGKPIDEVALHETLRQVMDKAHAQGRTSAEASHAGLADLDALLGLSPDTPEPTQAPQGLAQLDALLAVPEASSNHENATNFIAPAVESAGPEAAKAAKAAKAQALKSRMLAVFKEQAPQRTREIEEAIAQDDWNTVAIVVHGIKGSAAYIWPDGPLYHQAAALEKMADERRTHDFEAGFTVLKATLQAELQAS